MNDLISVIVPVYKVEKYLIEALDSVRNQTYTNFECIIVDDGSPDNCPKMCDDYAAADSRFKVIHKENGGLSSARNAGIEAAHGDWITFLDSDDMYHPNFLEEMLEVAKNHDVDLVKCDFMRFNTLQEIKEKEYELHAGEHEIYYISGINEIVENYLDKHLYKGTYVWNTICRASVFNTNNDLRFKDKALWEDDEIYFKWLNSVDKIAYYRKVLNYYRNNPCGITLGQGSEIKYRPELVEHTKNHILYWIEHDVKRNLVRKQLKKSTLHCIYAFYILKKYGESNEELNRCKKTYDELYLIAKKQNMLYAWRLPLWIFKISPKLFWLCGGGAVYYFRRMLVKRAKHKLNQQIKKALEEKQP